MLTCQRSQGIGLFNFFFLCLYTSRCFFTLRNQGKINASLCWNSLKVNVLLSVPVRGPLVSSSDEYMLYIPSHITWPEHHQPSAPSAHQPTTQHSAGPTLCLTNFSFYFITTPGHINSNVICNECQLKKHFKTKSKMINKHPIYKYNINICIFCSQSILYNKLYNLTILNIHMLITIIVNLLFVHVYVNIFRSRRLIMP